MKRPRVRTTTKWQWRSAVRCAFLFTTTCFAQSFPATTFDGSDVYFSTFARLPGSNEAPQRTTIFHYNSGNWAAVARSDADGFGNVGTPFVSGDGKIVGWEKAPYILFSSCGSCIPRSTSAVSGIDPQPVKIFAYLLTISSNSRFLATPGFLGNNYKTPPQVQDLVTGQVWTLSTLSALSFSAGAFKIADDGTLLGLKVDSSGFPTAPPALIRWRPGAPDQEIALSKAPTGLTLSADGRHAVALIDSEVRLLNLDSGASDRIAATASRFIFASVSADGDRVLYYSIDPEAWFWERGASAPVALSGIPEGVAQAVISGNGAIAWVSTRSNRLLRFDLDQGSSDEILSEFPTQLFNYSSGVPGSAFRYQGSAPVAGEHFRSGGLEFPVVPNSDPNTTVIQIPWELNAPVQGFGSIPLVLQKDGYPFELPLTFTASSRVTPMLEALPPIPGRNNLIVKAATSDFSQLIDFDHPAVPGETIVIWLTGLGPLDIPLPTGTPGPSNPPAHPLAHLECGLADPAVRGFEWRGLELPFVGYAPGLLGEYQVNVKIPADWPSGASLIDCYSGTQSSVLDLPIGGAQ